MTLDIRDLESLVVRSARGRQPAPVAMTYVRDLGAEDADVIERPPELGSKPPTIARLRTAHHALARLLAEGVPAVQASAITGYSPSRISILQNDPAFQELLEYYKSQVAEQYLNVHERLGALGMSAVDELGHRLEEEPESFKNRELMELAEMALDRSLTRDAPAARRGSALVVEFVAPTAPAPGGTPTPREAQVIDAQVIEDAPSASRSA